MLTLFYTIFINPVKYSTIYYLTKHKCIIIAFRDCNLPIEKLNLFEVDSSTLNFWMTRGEVILIDVRETHEFEFENIPGSLLLPLSFFDISKFPRLLERKIVFMCSVGKRSMATVKHFTRPESANIFSLKGGINAWKKAGFETQGGKFETMDWTI